MVDFDGKNCFPNDEPWLTDDYGDYVRNYRRVMDAVAALTAPGQDHILSSTSVIQQADYEGSLKKYYGLGFENVDSNKVKLFYRTFDSSGIERIRLKSKPAVVLLDYKSINESLAGEGYEWKPMAAGGLLIVRRENGKKIILLK